MKFFQLRDKIQIYDILALILIGVAFIYTILRAYYLGITHDEAVTYLYHAAGSYPYILFYNGSYLPNNHLLNSLLIKLSVSFFGLSEFSLRVPALIGHALYLVGVHKTLKLFLKKELLLCGVCIFIFNPFMLQLFALGRGYALGLGFVSFGTYYLLSYIKEHKDKSMYVNWMFLMFACATMSCFTFFHVYLAVFILLAGIEMISKHGLGKLFASVIPSLLLLVITCLLPVIKMHQAQSFIAELGDRGFWANTVLSLIDGTIYHQPYFYHPWAILVIEYFIISVIIMAGFLAVISLRSKEPEFQQPSFVLLRCVSAWLIISCLLIMIEGNVVKFGYISGRTAIYFIPLFYLLLLLVVQCLILAAKETGYLRWGLNYFVITLAFVCLVHFIQCANLRSFYRVGAYSESSQDLIKYLMRSHKGEGLKDRSVSIGTHRNFTPMLDFYILMYKVRWLKFLPYQEDLPGNFDYYYLSSHNEGFMERSEMENELKIVYSGKHLKVLKVFRDGTYLALPLKP